MCVNSTPFPLEEIFAIVVPCSHCHHVALLPLTSAMDLNIFDGMQFGDEEVDPAEEVMREIEAIEAQCALPQPRLVALTPNSPAPLPPQASAPPSPASFLAVADTQSPPPPPLVAAMPSDSDEELASVALTVVQFALPQVQTAISSSNLRAAVEHLLSGRDLTQTTMRTLRACVNICACPHQPWTCVAPKYKPSPPKLCRLYVQDSPPRMLEQRTWARSMQGFCVWCTTQRFRTPGKELQEMARLCVPLGSSRAGMS